MKGDATHKMLSPGPKGGGDGHAFPCCLYHNSSYPFSPCSAQLSSPRATAVEHLARPAFPSPSPGLNPSLYQPQCTTHYSNPSHVCCVRSQLTVRDSFQYTHVTQLYSREMGPERAKSPPRHQPKTHSRLGSWMVVELRPFTVSSGKPGCGSHSALLGQGQVSTIYSKYQEYHVCQPTTHYPRTLLHWIPSPMGVMQGLGS